MRHHRLAAETQLGCMEVAARSYRSSSPDEKTSDRAHLWGSASKAVMIKITSNRQRREKATEFCENRYFGNAGAGGFRPPPSLARKIPV